MGNRKYFPAYFSYLETLEDLSDEQVGRVFRASLKYAMSGEIPTLDTAEKVAFKFIKMEIDKSVTAYEELCKTNAENGSKGGRPPKANGSDKNRTVISETEKTERFSEKPEKPIEKEKENEKENEISPYGDICASEAAQTPPKKKNSAPVKRFVPPTPDEVNAFCAEHGYNIDGGAFVDWYQRAGWVLKGGTPMKDWQAAVRTWVRNDKKRDSAGYTSAQSEYGSMMDFLNEEIAKGGLSFNDQSGNSTDSQGTQNSVPEFLLTDAPF